LRVIDRVRPSERTLPFKRVSKKEILKVLKGRLALTYLIPITPASAASRRPVRRGFPRELIALATEQMRLRAQLVATG